MASADPSGDPDLLPLRLRVRLEEYRRRVWLLKTSEGLLAAAAGLLLSCLLVFLLDRFADTPALARLALLLAGTAGCYLYLPLGLRRWVLGHRRLDQVARGIRRGLPRLGDQLLGVVELAREGAPGRQSPELLRAAIGQVDEELSRRDLSRALPRTRFRAWGWAAAVPAALLLCLLLLVPPAAHSAFLRWILPLGEAGRFTFARIAEVEGGATVPYAEPLELVARLDPGSHWKPRSARLGGASAPREAGAYRFALPPQTAERTIQLRVGDDRRPIPLRPAFRPRMEELWAQVSLPGYLQREEPLRLDALGGIVRPLRESRVSFHGTASRPLAWATLDGAEQEVEGAALRTAALLAEEDSIHLLAWGDRLGLASREPRTLSVEPGEDRAPRAEILAFRGQLVLLSTEALDLDLRAVDDYGVRRAGLEWESLSESGAAGTVRGERIAFSGDPSRTDAVARAAFRPGEEGIEPQTLRLRAWAEDYLPGRERSGSPWMLVHVMSPEEHLQWIAQRLAEWLQALREVQERERLLHQNAEELLALTPEELAQEERQAGIRELAEAERANASRAAELAEEGRQRLAEAMRNQECDPQDLENWARSLETLERLASDRMPLVALLLEELLWSEDPYGEDPQAQDQQDGSPALLLFQTPGLPGRTEPAEEESGERGEQEEDSLERALEVQEGVVEALEEILDALTAIRRSLQRSTFVSRLRYASREQWSLAVELEGLGTFGLSETGGRAQARLGALAERQTAASESMGEFLEELEAFVERIFIERYREVLAEMGAAEVEERLAELAQSIRSNRVGLSAIESVNWAELLEAWAQDLAGSGEDSGQGDSGGGGDSGVPPGLVLELVRIVEGELDLRDGVRGWKAGDPGSERGREEGVRLGETQSALADRTRALLRELWALPVAPLLQRDLLRIGLASEAMDEASRYLLEKDVASPYLEPEESGARALGAINEAIELLLQGESEPGGGRSGSGGSAGSLSLLPSATMLQSASSGGADPQGGTGGSALMRQLLRRQGGIRALIEMRAPEQSTGLSGREWPAEYRQGMDAFIRALEEEMP